MKTYSSSRPPSVGKLWRRKIDWLSALLLAGLFGGTKVLAASESDLPKTVRPLLENYCFSCHDETAKGGINLESMTEEANFWREPKKWEKALQQIRDQGMPPLKKTQPKPEERAAMVGWLQATLSHPDPAKVPRSAGRRVIHRLSRLEYDNTIRDLLGVNTHPSDQFPPDGGGGGGFDNNASTLFVPPILMEKYLSVAGDLTLAAQADQIFHVRPGTGQDDAAAARGSIIYLAERAFRRPLQAEEIQGLLSLYDAARQRGETWEDAVRLSGRAILISPSFLFRIDEAAGPAEHGVERLNDWSIASRLSYFLWASLPDDALRQAAASGKLHEVAELERQVHRMLADPKARALAQNFGSQWLRTKELNTFVHPAADKFPEYRPELREAMVMEPVEFLAALFRENRPVTDCLNADYTYANAVLAKYYGLPEVPGGLWQRVALTDHRRGGVATMAGVLTLTSYPRRTSPVLRGKWVMEEILGTPPPPPPPMIKSLPTSDKAQNGQTFRQQLEQHRKNPECAGCHKAMDQLGFGLENFNPIGTWRADVSGAPVDAAGELPSGGKFNGPGELKKLLLERKDEFVRNLTEKLLAYALGRGVENGDWLAVQQIAQACAQDGYQAQRLVLEIVKCYPFQNRNSAEVPKTASTP